MLWAVDQPVLNWRWWQRGLFMEEPSRAFLSGKGHRGRDTNHMSPTKRRIHHDIGVRMYPSGSCRYARLVGIYLSIKCMLGSHFIGLSYSSVHNAIQSPKSTRHLSPSQTTLLPHPFSTLHNATPSSTKIARRGQTKRVQHPESS